MPRIKFLCYLFSDNKRVQSFSAYQFCNTSDIMLSRYAQYAFSSFRYYAFSTSRFSFFFSMKGGAGHVRYALYWLRPLWLGQPERYKPDQINLIMAYDNKLSK